MTGGSQLLHKPKIKPKAEAVLMTAGGKRAALFFEKQNPYSIGAGARLINLISLIGGRGIASKTTAPTSKLPQNYVQKCFFATRESQQAKK